MNLKYIANIRIPTDKAHGRQIMEMGSAFVATGVNLELVVPNRKNVGLESVNIFEFYKVKEDFKIRKIKVIDPLFLMRFPGGLYIKFQSLFFIIGLFFYLLFLKNRKECVFYVRDEYLLSILNYFSDRVYWEGHNLPKRVKSYVKQFNKCAGIVTISSGLKNDLIDLGVKSKIIVVADGVNLDKFANIIEEKKDIRERFNLPVDKKIALYSGHLYDWKGVQTVADAAKMLHDVLFVFVGGTKEDVKAFKKRNTSDNVLILGHQPHEDIPYYLKAADVLILPNSAKDKISSHYTSPLKLFEYMASGVPIVASDLPSIREVLNDKNSLFFKADDKTDLANKLEMVLSDSGLGEVISGLAYDNVLSYTWKNRAKKIAEFIK